MFKKAEEMVLKATVKVIYDQRGQGVLEYFLVLVGMGVAAAFFVSNLANEGIGPKFTELTGKIKGIKLPNIGLN